jgi:Family of unknown function (DUF6090)
MKKILETLQRKWTEYLLEVIVIVAGILIAFMLNNWKENSDAEKVELRFYEALLSDLKANQTEIEKNTYWYIDLSGAAIDTILNQLSNKSPNEAALNSGIRTIMLELFFNNSNTTYQYMLNEGFNFINNDSLRLKISNLYEIRFENTTNQELRYKRMLQENLVPIIKMHFRNTGEINVGYDYEIQNMKGLVNHLTFRNDLLALRNSKRLKVNYNDMTLDDIAELISNIQDIMAQMSDYEKPPPVVIDSVLINQITGKYDIENSGIAVEIFEENGKLFILPYQDYTFYNRIEILQVSGYQFEPSSSIPQISKIQFISNDNNVATGGMVTTGDGTQIPVTKIE